MARLYVRADPSVRFWKYVNKNGPNGCWIWQGSKDKLGYGRFNPGKPSRPFLIHHFAWNEIYGRFPKDCLLHHCDNPSCCNPDHLFEGSRKDNVDDMIAKGRMPRGEKRGHAKLNPRKVLRILQLVKSERSMCSIARQYNVSHHVICGIRDGVRWTHIPRVPQTP
jgi:hypothetical protein